VLVTILILICSRCSKSLKIFALKTK